ncbi:MAG: Uma2 family endonuclease [Cyanobacteria bacterium J06598_1]
MVQALTKPITLEDFLALPETKPASEYFDGKVSQKPMPQGEHSRIQIKLGAALDAKLSANKTAAAFTELRCTFDGRSILPNISVFIWNRIPLKENGRVENAFLIPPDWTIEILSPGPGYKKVNKKILHCLENGSAMGWLIDPSEDAVYVHQPDQRIAIYDLVDHTPETLLPVPEFAQEFNLSIGELFAWLVL